MSESELYKLIVELEVRNLELLAENERFRENLSIRFDPVELDKWMRSGCPHVLNDVIRSYG